MTRVLLTGNEGYLGTELTRALLQKGYDVLGFDSWLYGPQYQNNIECAGYDWLKVDIRDGYTLGEYIRKADAVIHLAGIVGDKACDLDPDRTIEVNQIATYTIRSLCRLYDKRLIFASTCSVYGESGDSIFDEGDGFTELYPQSLYALGKYSSEKAIQTPSIWMNHVILRMGTLFGLSHRMRFDLAINRFVAMAYNKEPITVYGGEQWRPFLHIQDAIQAYIMALEKPEMTGIYNVASLNAQLGDVGQTIAERYNVSLVMDKSSTDKRSYQADCSKIERLGFKPEYGLFKGIDGIWQAFRQGQFANYKDPRFDNYAYLKSLKA